MRRQKWIEKFEIASNSSQDITSSDFDDKIQGHKKRRWTRTESSLSVLTARFLEQIQKSKDGTVDLNKAVGLLQVQKWWIYDITNVLEGIGYIVKTQKNKIKLASLNDQVSNTDLVDLQDQLEAQEMESSLLDKELEQTQLKLEDFKKNKQNREFLFLTQRDISFLLEQEQISVPFFLIQATDQTKIEYFVPSRGIAKSPVAPQFEYNAILESPEELQIFIATKESQ